MDILTAFRAAFERKKEKNWEKIYVLVDIHDTILKACYQAKEQYKYFAYAKPALRLMSERSDICLILWSSCFDKDIRNYSETFGKEGINFQYINVNPEVEQTSFQDFRQKLYFNVGIDDRFGFEPHKDWRHLWHYLRANAEQA